jgi:hypothetical protein
MCSNRNRLLRLILPGLVLGLLLVCGLTDCTTGTDTRPTPALDETQAQPQARDDTTRLEKEVAELKEKAAKLERENEELRNEVKHKNELLKNWSICPPFGPLNDQPAISAVVQKVNEELKFVMLSVGGDEKVTKGMRFYVHRSGSYVGEVQVDYVYPKSCSASYVRLKPGMSIQVGDAAVTRL